MPVPILRIFSALSLFAAAILCASAELPLPPDPQAASTEVTANHVVAELIGETASAQPGRPFDVLLHLRMEPGWHTYWKNPGDSGLATSVDWTLPEGSSAGPIQWPVPERINTGGEISFGYTGDVYLLTTVTPPKPGPPPATIAIKATVKWLVCKEACIPGKANLELDLNGGKDGSGASVPSRNTALFAAARARLPVKNSTWDLTANHSNGQVDLAFTFKPAQGEKQGSPPENPAFFPDQANAFSSDPVKMAATPGSPYFHLFVPLQKNGELPASVSGVLVSDAPLIGSSKAILIGPVANNPAPLIPLQPDSHSPISKP